MRKKVVVHCHRREFVCRLIYEFIQKPTAEEKSCLCAKKEHGSLKKTIYITNDYFDNSPYNSSHTL